MRYEVRLAPGCHDRPEAPVVSTWRTWPAALKAAVESDRREAVDTETGRRACLPPMGSPKYGPGRYGKGLAGAQKRLWLEANTAVETEGEMA
jgi:hypothetical protein